MTPLSRDAILNVLDLPTKTVEVPEWGGSVTLRELTGTQRDAYQMLISARSPDGKLTMQLDNFRAKLLAFSLVDAQGAPLFSEADIDKLGAKNGLVLARLYGVAQALSGLGTEGEDAAVGNSTGTPSDSSGMSSL